MRELKADDEVGVIAPVRPVGGAAECDQGGQIFLIFLAEDQLMGIGPAVRPHGHGLAATDELGAAFTKTLPPPTHVVGDASGERAIPSFHGVNRHSVADGAAVEGQTGDGLKQRRSCARDERLVAGNVQPETGRMLAKGSRRF